MSNAVYTPTPVLDIVSFGYRKLFDSLLPLTKLSIPFLLFVSITSGLVYPEFTNLKASHEFTPSAIFAFTLFYLAYFVMFYTVYISLRYVKAVYDDTIEEPLFSYALPDKTFWGILGIIALHGVGFIAALIVVALGFVLLILPGLAALAGLVFASVRLSMAWITYMSMPEKGIIEAFKDSWRLTEGNFWRTVGLGFLIGIIQTIILMPFSFIDVVLQLLSTFNPSFSDNPVFPVFYAVSFALKYWALFVVGMGGSVFIYYRYLYDLKCRKEPGVVDAQQASPTADQQRTDPF